MAQKNKNCAVMTYPHYSGIFINKHSKNNLFGDENSNNNVFKPRFNRLNAHHVTLKFNPGGDFTNIHWGAYVEMKIVRHAFNDEGQGVELVPIKFLYRRNKDNAIEITDTDEIIKLLEKDSGIFALTLSLCDGEGNNNNLMSPSNIENTFRSSDEELTKQGFTVERYENDNYIVGGFIGIFGDIKNGKPPNRKRYDNQHSNYSDEINRFSQKNNYGGNNNYGSNNRYNSNKDYTPNNRYNSNKDYTPNNRYNSNKDYSQNNRYNSNKDYGSNNRYNSNKDYGSNY